MVCGAPCGGAGCNEIHARYLSAPHTHNVPCYGWYDSPEVLAAIPTDPAVEACYPETVADGAAFGAVWGNRNDVVKKALASRGVAYEFGSLPRGFMKSAPHSGFDPTLYPGPPIIWMSKRWVMPGRNPNSAYAADRAWQHPLSVLC